MIRIGIVDDEEQMRNMIEQNIQQSVTENAVTELVTFSSGEAFLESIRAGQVFDIVFTDIQMAEMDGMELGKEIRKIQPEMYLIFITSYAEYAAESYLLEAYQYILKHDLEYRLPIVMRQLIDKIERQNRKFRMVGTNSEKSKIYFRDIIYIYKSKGAKYVNFATMDGEYRERIGIEQVYQELDSKEFVFVDRGCIVNMKHICKLSGDTIYLEKDYEVQVSRAKLPEVKQAIHHYWREL